MGEQEASLAAAREYVVQMIEVRNIVQIPSGLWRFNLETALDFAGRDLILRLTGYVYGERGVEAIEAKSYTRARFPRWLPKWLKRRWSEERTFTLNATPMLLFPDATLAPPALGAPIFFSDVTTQDTPR